MVGLQSQSTARRQRRQIDIYETAHISSPPFPRSPAPIRVGIQAGSWHSLTSQSFRRRFLLTYVQSSRSYEAINQGCHLARCAYVVAVQHRSLIHGSRSRKFKHHLRGTHPVNSGGYGTTRERSACMSIKDESFNSHASLFR